MNGVQLHEEVGENLGLITADQRMVKQVLLNLLANALKFTPDGGSVTLRACKSDPEVVISIIDTGIGIRKEDHEMIFEEFSQSGDNYTSKQEGTGLGLALSRRLAELHGGHLKVESEPGQGSTFTFTLPIQGTGALND
jgi:signal transduction histidine kinase